MTPIPDGLAALRHVYGDPRPYADSKATWETLMLAVETLPTPLPYAYDAGVVIRRVRAHRLVVDELVGTLMACLDAGVPAHRLQYGGCYVWRPMRGAARLSTHTWGIAVDLEPVANPLGRRWVDDGVMLDPRVIATFEARGWQWGGRWSRPDAQHFQRATGY